MADEECELIERVKKEYKVRYLRPAYSGIRKVEELIASGAVTSSHQAYFTWLQITAPVNNEKEPIPEPYQIGLTLSELLSIYRPPPLSGAPVHPRTLTVYLKLFLDIPYKVVIQDEVKDNLAQCAHKTKAEMKKAREKFYRRARIRAYKARRWFIESGQATLLQVLLTEFGKDAFDCAYCYPTGDGGYELLPRPRG